MQKHQHGGNLNLAARKYGLDPEKILDFSVNTNPLGPPEVIHALLEKGLRYVTAYPEPYCETLKEEYASSLSITPDQLIFTNGAVELIYMVIQALRPRTVLIPAPTFSEYEIAARAFQTCLKLFRLPREKDFLPELNALIRAARGVDMVFLCNPNNPTANLYPPEILQPFFEFCDAEGIFVIIDESFLIFHKHWLELSAVPKTKASKNLLILQSLTKFYSIPGLRVGYGVAHPETIALLSRFQPPWQVNSLAQVAAKEILKDDSFKLSTCTYVEQERSQFSAALSAVNEVRVYPSDAPFLLLALGENLTAPSLVDSLARKGILVRDCSNFAYLGNNHIRVAVKDREKNSLLVIELTKSVNEQSF